MEKSVDEISKVLKKQLKQFEDLSQNLTQNYQVLVAQAQALQVQLQEASGK